VVPKRELAQATKLQYEPGRTVIEKHDSYAYEDLLPSFPDVHWDPIEEAPYQDKGLQGDPKFGNLLGCATDIFDYNPKIGTEIHGVDLNKLTDAQKNDLARLIAVRGVVFFRGQDNFDIEAQLELGRYFGRLHKVGSNGV
jgi:taurine dioxygenase